jgi:ATP/maltotriose-dependent transcriptional regulator MalT/DNA-binding SARP family transcriptional activator
LFFRQIIMFEELVIRTKLAPPRVRRHTLHRPRLIARLAEAIDHRLSIIHAATGYGKSTALGALDDQEFPLCWYSIASEDNDPFVFFLHLVHACQFTLADMSHAPLAALERQSQQLDPNGWKVVVHVLINALDSALNRPTLLVLDDYHLVGDVPQISAMVDRLISYAPDDLHVILSGRHPPSLAGLVSWRVRGELLEIDHQDLAFTDDEVTTLYREQYGYHLSPSEVKALMAETEGWAIALQLIWQGLRSGAVTDLSARPSAPAQRSSLDDLFSYLAQEVFDKQSLQVQHFLRSTSVLRRLTPAACDALRPWAPHASSRQWSGEAERANVQDSAGMLSFLHERDLFLIDLGDGQSRYHHLFHDFLRQQLPDDRAQDLNRRAAAYYRSVGGEEEVIYHLLSANALEDTAELLDEMGENLVRQGRLDTLAGWIDRLTPSILEEHPALLICLGDIARLRSHFDEALGWYLQAEAYWRSQDDRMGASCALQRQALVYLDTVRPARAESLLAEALRLSEGQQDRQERARLLELLAENKLNLGHPQEAEQLRAQARQWREEGPSERQIHVRVLIRTGQLDRARALLEAEAGGESASKDLSHLGRSHHSHREVQMLLSLVYAFQGEAEAALKAAQAGIAIGQRLGSPFVKAVGYMRLGHAWAIRQQPEAHLRAIECYKQAIALGDVVAVQRTRVEAQWGLCRAYGFHGDLTAAEEAAALGIEIGRRAGDPWVVALIELTLGASYVLESRQREAVGVLQRAMAAFRDCSDNYGRTAALLWLGLAFLRLGQNAHLAETTDELLRLIETHHYDHLFTHRALLGPPDNHALVPLLLEARRRRRRPGTAAWLLNEMGLPDVEFHPGYQLRVQTLGPFRVWRGEQEIKAREWRRVKARQLFQLLLTRRGRTLQREEIVDVLWPNLDPEAIQRDFKVALNALNKALEPDRPPGAEPAFVDRHGTTYRLRQGADLWIDAVEFQNLIDRADHNQEDPEASARLYEGALKLYQGDFLQDSLYEDWTSEERQRLQALYLHTSEKLGAAHVQQGRYDEAIDLCRRILVLDNCWERAYRLMMAAFAHGGNTSRALRVFQTCEATMQRELGTQPSAATMRLYEQICRDVPNKDWEI